MSNGLRQDQNNRPLPVSDEAFETGNVDDGVDVSDAALRRGFTTVGDTHQMTEPRDPFRMIPDGGGGFCGRPHGWER